MEPEQPQLAFFRSHGQVKDEMPVVAVEEQGRLDREEVGVIFHKKVTAQLVSSLFDLLEHSVDGLGIQIVNGQPAMDGSLYRMNSRLNSMPELVLDSGHSRVDDGWSAGYDQNKSCS